MQLTKQVTVTIEGRELIELIIAALCTKAKCATSKEQTLFTAFGHLIGCSDVEAVKMANCKADDQGLPRIKVAELRCWLPQILSETFAEFMEESRATRISDQEEIKRAFEQLANAIDSEWGIPAGQEHTPPIG